MQDERDATQPVSCACARRYAPRLVSAISADIRRGWLRQDWSAISYI